MGNGARLLAAGQAFAQAVRPLVNDDLSAVFYDVTTVRAEGLSEEESDIRQFGMSKESIIARQFMLGLVQTAARESSVRGAVPRAGALGAAAYPDAPRHAGWAGVSEGELGH